ncbi:serum response factor-binding protein 1-like [Ctenocephalides felis]|uniref:serum response factor-binding protein 1-like n=1 Tax=Ctenocephalides felis TaxID=7515 RepID=UPI000E6E2E8D|nr:serum response factor-binding protein 1-like [Ctenocephalides felis]
MNKAELNNEIVLMRKTVRQAKVHIIRKLVREIRILKEKTKPEGGDKFKAKADRLYEELTIIKKLDCDVISKHALTLTEDPKKILSKAESLHDRALNRFAVHKSVCDKVKSIREKYNLEQNFEKVLEPGKKKQRKLKHIEDKAKKKEIRRENARARELSAKRQAWLEENNLVPMGERTDCGIDDGGKGQIKSAKDTNKGGDNSDDSGESDEDFCIEHDSNSESEPESTKDNLKSKTKTKNQPDNQDQDQDAFKNRDKLKSKTKPKGSPPDNQKVSKNKGTMKSKTKPKNLPEQSHDDSEDMEQDESFMTKTKPKSKSELSQDDSEDMEQDESFMTKTKPKSKSELSQDDSEDMSQDEQSSYDDSEDMPQDDLEENESFTKTVDDFFITDSDAFKNRDKPKSKTKPKGSPPDNQKVSKNKGGMKSKTKPKNLPEQSQDDSEDMEQDESFTTKTKPKSKSELSDDSEDMSQDEQSSYDDNEYMSQDDLEENESFTKTVDDFFITDSGTHYESTFVPKPVKEQIHNDGLNRQQRRAQQFGNVVKKRPPKFSKKDSFTKQKDSKFNHNKIEKNDFKFNKDKKPKFDKVDFKSKNKMDKDDSKFNKSVNKKAVPEIKQEVSLHPSWEAKKKLKPQITAFQGKKIVFDD